jgi:hypothetical protein
MRWTVAIAAVLLLVGAKPDLPLADTERALPSTDRAAGQTCLKLYWTSPPRCAVRPHRYALGARASLTKIRWTYWKKRRAVGRGKFYVGGSWGMPESGIGPTRAKVILSKAVNCFGEWRAFSRMTVKYGRRFGKVGMRSPVFQPCRAVAGPRIHQESQLRRFSGCGNLTRKAPMAVLNLRSNRRCGLARRVAALWREKLTAPGPQTCMFQACAVGQFQCHLQFLIPASPNSSARAGIFCRHAQARLKWVAIQKLPPD